MRIPRRVLTVSVLTAFTATLSHAQSGLPEDLAGQLDAMFAAAQLDVRAPGLVYGVVDRDNMLQIELGANHVVGDDTQLRRRPPNPANRWMFSLPCCRRF